MFDRCWLWRRRLSRQADGTLPPAQLGALQDHLAHCERCGIAARADHALGEVLRTHTGMLDSRAAAALDDRIVARVFAGRAAFGNSHCSQARPQPPVTGRTMSFLYLVQIVGGGFTAAAMTALLLAPTLHPATDTARMRRNPVTIDRSEPPVPLGSLLQTASPRAALLWTTPQSTPRSAAPGTPAAGLPARARVPASFHSTPTSGKQRHTMLDSSGTVGA